MLKNKASSEKKYEPKYPAAESSAIEPNLNQLIKDSSHRDKTFPFDKGEPAGSKSKQHNHFTNNSSGYLGVTPVQLESILGSVGSNADPSSRLSRPKTEEDMNFTEVPSLTRASLNTEDPGDVEDDVDAAQEVKDEVSDVNNIVAIASESTKIQPEPRQTNRNSPQPASEIFTNKNFKEILTDTNDLYYSLTNDKLVLTRETTFKQNSRMADPTRSDFIKSYEEEEQSIIFAKEHDLGQKSYEEIKEYLDLCFLKLVQDFYLFSGDFSEVSGTSEPPEVNGSNQQLSLNETVEDPSIQEHEGVIIYHSQLLTIQKTAIVKFDIDIIRAENISNWLNKLLVAVIMDGIRDIQIPIKSKGGVVLPTIVACCTLDWLREDFGVSITTIAYGKIVSAAVNLFQCGDKRIIVDGKGCLTCHGVRTEDCRFWLDQSLEKTSSDPLFFKMKKNSLVHKFLSTRHMNSIGRAKCDRKMLGTKEDEHFNAMKAFNHGACSHILSLRPGLAEYDPKIPYDQQGTLLSGAFCHISSYSVPIQTITIPSSCSCPSVSEERQKIEEKLQKDKKELFKYMHNLIQIEETTEHSSNQLNDFLKKHGRS